MAGTSINDQILNSLKALTTNKTTSTSMKAELDLQTTDWLTLLVAQLKNQDMNNTMDTGEMMSQMAQFSQIQAIQNLVSLEEETYAMNTTSYAASLIGKDVTVAEIKTTVTSSGTKEELVTTKGTVTGVTLFEGQPIIYIGDKAFSLSQIMIVGDVPTEEEDGGGEGDGSGEGGTDAVPPDNEGDGSGGGSDVPEVPPNNEGTGSGGDGTDGGNGSGGENGTT